MKLLKFNVEPETPPPAPDPDGIRNVFYDYIRHPEFKRILHFIVTMQGREGFGSIAILSKYPGEGKTFLTSVIALGYATFLNRRVLIVDSVSQTRNESFYMGRILGSDAIATARAPGFIDLMTTRTIRQQTSRRKLAAPEHMRNEEEEVYNTSDFQIGAFMETIRASYDLILVDTCALTEAEKSSMDPIILAKEAHTSILVTSPRSVERDNLRGIKTELHRLKVRPMGTVFNSGLSYE